MHNDDTLRYIGQMDGVEGIFISTSEGYIINSQMPSVYPSASLKGIATSAAKVIRSFKAEVPDCEEINLYLEFKTLFVREVKGHLFIILVNDTDSLDKIRAGTKIATRHYEPVEHVELKTHGVSLAMDNNGNAITPHPLTPPTGATKGHAVALTSLHKSKVG